MFFIGNKIISGLTSKYHLAIAKQFPAAVKAIYTAADKSYSPIKLCGVVRSSENDTNTMVDELPMVIEYYTPYKTMGNQPVTIKFALGPNVAVNSIH